MKKILILLWILILSALAFSYENVKKLTLPAGEIQALIVDAGAGSLEIEGVEGLTQIEVEAELHVRSVSEAKIDDFIADRLRLSLEQRGEDAVLKGYFDMDGFRLFSGEASVDLTVRMPKGMDLEVDDGSGEMIIRGIRGDVEVDDGSGEMTVENVEGDLSVDDGSGEMDIRNVTGTVRIDDGSGGIRIFKAGGSVIVDDGSGDIEIEDVGGDVILDSTGSGSVRTDNVRGRVIKE